MGAHGPGTLGFLVGFLAVRVHSFKIIIITTTTTIIIGLEKWFIG